MGIQPLTADTATILFNNLPDTSQLYLYLGSYGSDVELFVHTVERTCLMTLLIQKWTKAKSAE